MLNLYGAVIAVKENEEPKAPPPKLVRQSPSACHLHTINSSSVSPNNEIESTKHSKQKKSKSSTNISLLDISHAVSESFSPMSIDKICIGDKIRITIKNKKTQKTLTNVKGVVMYIGYPYLGHGIRYGINLHKAVGEHNGSLMFDVQTGKLAKKSRIKRYVKSIKKRTFFKAKKKHGIFVKKRDIICIDRESTISTRFTINDKVQVRYKGDGYIKFIGNLQHKKKDMGIWYGIQLTKQNGRHDGTVDNVKYFQCQPQYGLICRQSHLTLSHSNDLQKSNNQKRRPSAQLKEQTSDKWKKVLLASDMTGYNRRQHIKSAVNLQIPKTNITAQTSESISSLIELDETVNDISHKLNEMHHQLSVLPKLKHNITPHIVPQMKDKTSVSLCLQNHISFIRGETTYILPNYHEKYKQKKFDDYYDVNEFEDELGEGEFGIVYKCRKKTANQSFSSSFQTEMSSTRLFDGVSDSDSVEFPGDHWSDCESDSAVYPGDSTSDNEDSKHSQNETLYAVKKIKKAKFHHLAYKDKQDVIKLLQQEIKLLEKIQRLKQPHRKQEGSKYVIDLFDVFEDRNYLYIVTNFCIGGDLWQYIEKKDEDHSEQKIQCIMKQILEGLAFLHKHNMAHLDIKPDNIMLNENNEIQLIDFGMSRVIPPLTKAGVLVGTANFVAPEVIEGFYDKKADVWSVGVILFMLRFGYPPFHESTGAQTLGNHKGLFEQIKKGFNPIIKSGLGPWFPKEDPVSNELKDLISKMLTRDLANRATVAECLAHPYFETVADDKKLNPLIMDAFTKFSGQCRFRVMIAKLFVHQIEPSQMQQLTRIWNKFDIDNDGSLTLNQFKKVMSEYEHGYKEYQIEAIFESLDWNETETINFNSLLTAFSYQRLVAVDERLWEAFAELDVDDDGHITKSEIKHVLAKVRPDALNTDISRGSLNIQSSLFINDCINDVDWDDDGQVDYEEFLRALHPNFNEEVITPRIFQTPSLSQQIERSFVFQPSIHTAQTKKSKTIMDNYHKYRNKTN